jgi:DNA ligase (NAD+)
MSEKEIEQRARNLQQELRKHNYRYYVLNDPVISDYEYDQLLRELQEIEADHPDLVTPDSPTQRAGTAPAEGFARIPHPGPILSLANAYSDDELIAWFERIARLDERVREAEFVVEPKLDGLTVVLHYENGVFIQGATRGDGEVGEDITANLRTVRSLPLRIPADSSETPVPPRLVVRGEAIIYLDDFEALNRRLEQAGERTYVNPRNTASGALRQLDPSLTADRPIRLLCYAIVEGEGELPATQWEVLRYLRSLGFPVADGVSLENDIEGVLAAYKRWVSRRDELPYEADGIVVKLNDLELRESLGVVGKDPRGALAYKFPAQVVTTDLLDIGLNVGRTGVITPYAILDPVEVGGVTVRQATLHNFDFIEEKDIRIGDRVQLKRAGDVIPYIIGPVLEARPKGAEPYELPDQCPSCGEPLERNEEEVAVYCVNASCPAQLVRNVEHFASRGAMDIEGLGIRVAEQLVAEDVIGDVADLYRLKQEDLLELEGFGEKRAENLIDSIAGSRTQPLARLINALGIRTVGEVVAGDLARGFESLDRLANAELAQLEQVEGIGPVVAGTIVDWMHTPANQKLLKKLKAADVWPEEDREQEPAAPQTLEGLTFVITGTLPSWSREEAKDAIERHGGKTTGGVSSRTDYLVRGESPGSKLQKAQELGVAIIDEDDLRKLIESGSDRSG